MGEATMSTVSGYVESALEVLAKQGYRKTKTRRYLLQVLDQSTEPLSSYELAAKIKEQGDHCDVVTVYRIIETLESLELVHRVLSSGKYLKCLTGLEEKSHDDHHTHCHHHIICVVCNKLEEVHCHGLEGVLQGVESDSGYQINTHLLEFRGVCPACQKSGTTSF
jgi:Fur family transcriptional regulator, ferric uptake regulator